MVVSRPSFSPTSPLLDEVAAGRPLLDEEAWSLVDADQDTLLAMCEAASSMRDAGKGKVVSFSPKVFIPADASLPRLLRLLHLSQDPRAGW